jgi:hypothetical protein
LKSDCGFNSIPTEYLSDKIARTIDFVTIQMNLGEYDLVTRLLVNVAILRNVGGFMAASTNPPLRHNAIKVVIPLLRVYRQVVS